MIKRILLFLTVGQLLFYSCHISNDKRIICYQNFKEASDLVHANPTNKAALDSALLILDRSMNCDSIKIPVVDLKIRLLITLGKFKEGYDFVNSLKSVDLSYPYQKELNRNNFVALNFASKEDTAGRDNTFRKMIVDLEKYINSNDLNSKEFQEAFTDLFILKENLGDTIRINREIDSLKIKYPENAKFFDFYKH